MFFLIKCLSTQNYNIIDVLSCFLIFKVIEHSKYIILYFMVIVFNSIFSTHFFSDYFVWSWVYIATVTWTFLDGG